MTMTIKDITSADFIMPMFMAQQTVHFQSGPGQGKSEGTHLAGKVIAKATGKPCPVIDVMLTQADAPDMGGFMVPAKDAEGRNVAVYTLTSIQERVERAYREHNTDQCIVFLDEYLQADHLVQKATAPLLLDGISGQNKLPGHVWVVMASNRSQDRSGVNRALMHIVNRVTTIDIQPDLQGWLEWATEHSVHYLVRGFAQFRPDAVFTEEVPKDPQPFCTPRSLVKSNNILMRMAGADGEFPDTALAQEVVAGTIGQAAAAELFAFIRTREFLPTYEEVIADPKGAKLPPKDRLDAQYAASQMLVSHAEPTNIGQLFKYGQRLNTEMLTMMVRSMLRIVPAGALLSDPEIGKFITENNAIIAQSLEE